jgi:hypothetical protein
MVCFHPILTWTKRDNLASKKYYPLSLNCLARCRAEFWPWNAQVKDRLEDKLHELVCSGQLDLKTAQQAIASNWIEAYKKYVSPNPPIPESMSNRAPEAADTAGQVWVNTRSGKYWEPGSRFYGKTKQGQYMSEEEALQKGYRPANGTGE